MTQTPGLPELLPALPELVLVLGAMVLLLAGVFRRRETSGGIESAAILLLIVAGAIVVWLPSGTLVTFGGSFVLDSFARFMKLLALTGSAAAILMSFDYLIRENQQRFEFPVLILLSTAGMMILISAGDLIALYLGLELMSLALYVVAGGILVTGNLRGTPLVNAGLLGLGTLIASLVGTKAVIDSDDAALVRGFQGSGAAR